MVALAILRLQDRGKLAVRDRICHYLRGCPAAWRPLTIAELLTNDAGMGSYDPFDTVGGLAQTLAACKAMPLLAAPDTAGQPWSDCNTLLLGAILERVTGMIWAAAMQALVFGPAGMTGSGRMTNALKPPRRGRLYRTGFAMPELNYDGYNLVYTAAADLIRLNRAFLAGTLLSRRARDAMFTPRTHDPNDPTAPWLGYEAVLWPATATLYKRVCVSCNCGDGEDEEGLRAGLLMSNLVSPEAGSLMILIDNDPGYFDIDSDNAFFDVISPRLFGKTSATT